MCSKKTTGERIREARIRGGLTQKQVAERLGLNSYQSVAQWESGKRNPKINTLLKLAEILGYDILDIQIPEEKELTPEEQREHDLLLAYHHLNTEGRDVAVVRVKELTEIPKYQYKLPRNKPDGEK